MRSASLPLRLALLRRGAVDRHFAERDLGEIAGKIELINRLLARHADAATPHDFAPRLDEAPVGHPGLAVQVTIGGRTSYASGGHCPPRSDAVTEVFAAASRIEGRRPHPGSAVNFSQRGQNPRRPCLPAAGLRSTLGPSSIRDAANLCRVTVSHRPETTA